VIVIKSSSSNSCLAIASYKNVMINNVLLKLFSIFWNQALLRSLNKKNVVGKFYFNSIFDSVSCLLTNIDLYKNFLKNFYL
jgi:hypothetical protein